MLETLGIALATFFATISPIEVAAVFAALTTTASPPMRYSIAVRGCVTATIILLLFALVGKYVLALLGISFAAMRAAGGILLLLISIDMVFARASGAITTTEEEEKEAVLKQDIAVFPLATPLIAGPGAIGATMLLMAGAEGHTVHQFIVLASMLAIMLVTFGSMMFAGQINRILGVTGMHVINRILGILLAALAVQFVFDGIAQSGLLHG
jgi:multiple antibiotic resistance protein